MLAGFGQQMTFVFNFNKLFFHLESGGLAHHCISLGLTCFVFISQDQEIQEDIFYPNLFLHFCVLKMMDEITQCISKWTVAFIMPFSGREQILVNSQKLPLGWERNLLFLDFSFSATDQTTSYPHISRSLVLIGCLVVFEYHLSFASFF